MRSRNIWLPLLGNVLCAASGYAQSLVTLDIGTTAAQFTGSGSPVGTYRIEFRLENVQASRAVLSNGGGIGNLNCAISSTFVLACSQGGDSSPNGVPIAQFTGGGDFRVRFQRDPVGLTTTLESWSGNCQNYSKRQDPFSNGGPLPQVSTWYIGPSIDVSFLRGYSTLDTAGDCPVDAPVAAGDLFDFTFEGDSLMDRSAHGYIMTAPGSTFVNSAVYPPTVNVFGWTGAKPVFRAGQPLTLSGSASQCFSYPGTGTCSSYFWTQIAGPQLSAIAVRTGTSGTFTPPVNGQYTFQLTITDNTGARASGSQIVGVVATDSQDIVVLPNASFQYVMGNPLMFGQSPWPWYETTEGAVVDLMSAPVEAPINEVQGPGTCTIPATAPNQLSDGNITSLTYGGVALTCTGSNFTSADVGNYIDLHWDPDGNGSYLGRMVVLVNQYVSSTIIVSNQYAILEPAGSLSGLNYSRLGVGSGACTSTTATVSGGQVTAINAVGCSGFYWWALSGAAVILSGGGGSGCSVYTTITMSGTIGPFGNLPCGTGYTSAPTVTVVPSTDIAPYLSGNGASYIFDFYEAGLGIGRFYQKTQLSTYQTEFHSFCTNWWRYALDSGWANVSIPRNVGLDFMLACATDPSWTPPGSANQMFAGIGRIIQAIAPEVVYNAATGADTPGYNPTLPTIQGLFDPRESSYILRPTAALAELGGNFGLSTGTWCGYLVNQITNIWLAGAASPSGYPANTYSFFPENIYIGNVGEPGDAIPSITGPFGTSPWRSDGLPADALTYAYQTLSDPATCNSSALAGQLFTTGSSGSGLIPQLTNYIYTFGRSADGGLFTATSYANDTNGEDPTFEDYVAPNYHFYGQRLTYAGSGATAVAGVNGNTIFEQQFWPGATIDLGGTNCTVATVTNNYALTLNSGCAAPALTGTTNWGNPETIAVSNNSTAVIGTGTHFTTQFSGLYTKTCIYNAPTNDRNCFGVSVVDDTHLTLDAKYPGSSASGINTWLINRVAPSNCGPNSIATACNQDFYGGRNLSSDIAYSSAWLYQKTSAPVHNTRTSYYLNKLYGGAAGGSGSLGIPVGSSPAYLPGTITAVGFSTAITGVGTNFLGQFACNGTDSITIGDGTSGYTWSTVGSILTPTFYTVKVASCASATNLTLASPYPGAGSIGTGVFYNAVDPAWQGPDGATGNLGEVLPACQTTAPPCGSGDFVPKYGKPLGMASGAGNVPIAMAERLGGVAPVANQVFTIAFDLAAIARATQVTVSITIPDRTVFSSTCSASPCAVTADVREGAAELSIQYKSATGAVLASSSQQVIISTK